MKSHTYYDILGVSRDATLDEITTAKNALAKVYHPDANAHKNIDTTAFMQEILEAYRVLSNPEKRRKSHIKRYLKPALTGCACGKQLECMPVCGAYAYAGASV